MKSHVIAGIACAIAFVGGVAFEHYLRHGPKCEAAKEQHGVRLSGQSFEAGVAIGYQLHAQGWNPVEARDEAFRRRDQGWSNRAVFLTKPENRPYMTIQ